MSSLFDNNETITSTSVNINEGNECGPIDSNQPNGNTRGGEKDKEQVGDEEVIKRERETTILL